jgi:hypothetical protein
MQIGQFLSSMLWSFHTTRLSEVVGHGWLFSMLIGASAEPPILRSEMMLVSFLTVSQFN